MSTSKHPHNLLSLYEYLHQDIDKDIQNSFSIPDFFKYQIARDVVKAFLKYPFLQEIYIDFNTLEEMSNVWEGSSEFIISDVLILWEEPNKIINSKEYKNYQQKNPNGKESFSNFIQDNLIKNINTIKIPYYDVNFIHIENPKNLSTYIQKSNISHAAYINILDKLSADFNYLTEEPSFLKELLIYQKNNNEFSLLNFQGYINGEFNPEFIECVLNFLTPTVKSILSYKHLNQILNKDITFSKNINTKKIHKI